MSDYTEHLISMAGGDGEPDLDAIQARADKAAIGPWRWDENFGDKGDTGTALTNDAGTEIIGAYNWHCCSYRDEPTVDDYSADFIAHARTDVPALLAMVREQRAQLEAVEAVTESLDHSDHCDLYHFYKEGGCTCWQRDIIAALEPTK